MIGGGGGKISYGFESTMASYSADYDYDYYKEIDC